MFDALIRRLRLFKHLQSERRALDQIKPAKADASRLRRIGPADLQAIFQPPESASEWAEVSAELERIVHLEDMKTDGVNPGDRRALYHLVRALKPKRILEIGTNVGASTLNIAAAVKRTMTTDATGTHKLVTVDIRDVNDAPNAYWKLCNLPRPPRDNIAALGMAPCVTFVTTASLAYLDACSEQFDLIFLDGDHGASTVYQEIPKALRVLSQGGTILLHDFFPQNRPLWSNNAVIVGPQLGCERLQREGANFKVLPLGALPWPTKLGSNVTSLALIST